MNSQLRMKKMKKKMKRRQKKKTQCTREEEVLQWQYKPDWLGRWSFQRLVEWEWQEVLRSSGWTFIRETYSVTCTWVRRKLSFALMKSVNRCIRGIYHSVNIQFESNTFDKWKYLYFIKVKSTYVPKENISASRP